MVWMAGFRATEVIKNAPGDVIIQGSIGLTGMNIEILIGAQVALGDHRTRGAISCAGAMVLCSVEMAVLDQHPIPGTGMYGSMSLLSFESYVEYAYLVTGPEIDTFIPVVESTVAHPAVLDILHTQGLIRIIMDLVLMMDKLFRIGFPVAGKQDILYPALFEAGISDKFKRHLTQ